MLLERWEAPLSFEPVEEASILPTKQITVGRGVVRHLILCLDSTHYLESTTKFVLEFIDQNPLSTIHLVYLQNGLAQLVDPKELDLLSFGGGISLVNGLECALGQLSHTPLYSTREILVISHSLASIDPSNISKTLCTLVEKKVRVSFISLQAEVHICKKIAQETRGEYDVVVNDAHFISLLHRHLLPPPNTPLSALMEMGFPITIDTLTLCSCHSNIIKSGYVCPRCSSTLCKLPQDCPVCGLTNISSTALARSYHHLFPIVTFLPGIANKDSCDGCTFDLTKAVFACPLCTSEYCSDCDAYIHQILHACPGCTLK